MPQIVDIADALVNVLNEEDWSINFTAERLMLPSFELKDLKNLKVSVVPRGVTITQITRDKAAHDYQVDVGIQKKLQKADVPEFDPLLQLAEDVAEFFRKKRLTGMLSAMWLKSEIAPLYSPEHLEQYRQFTSVVIFTFRVIR